MVDGASWGPGGVQRIDPLAAIFPSVVDMDGIRVLRTGEKFALRGITLDMHGDRGPNGSRGSIVNLRDIGVKSVIGHAHSPGIDEGCWQVGCSCVLVQDYTEGAPSSWLNAHVLLHDDGKRQMLFVIDGRWRA